jgi:hypothetical protein
MVRCLNSSAQGQVYLMDRKYSVTGKYVICYELFKIHISVYPYPKAGSSHVGLVDKVALGQVFSEYFDFPCQS